MKFFKALAALPVLAAAAPSGSWDDNCITDAYAQNYVDQSIIFLQHFDVPTAIAAARSIFAENIVEFGDSINSLRGDPLGTQVENGLERYINETTATPPIKEIDTLSLIHDCNTIVWQWNFDLGLPNPPNNRIHGVTFAKPDSSGLIAYQYVEFNSLAWAENIGFTVIPPAGGIGGG